MVIEQQRYLAYMLRLRQVSGEGEPVWRASLESPHTGERYGFANLESLFTFLKEEAARQAADQPVGLTLNGG